MSNPLLGKNFLHVSYPSPESYYAIPNDWKLEDIKVIDGTLYHKGEKSSITAFDYIPKGQTTTLYIEDDTEAISRICYEYLHN
jgi:hypothetical protein